MVVEENDSPFFFSAEKKTSEEEFAFS